uniref:UPAR/Ly6 domain-containing protein n=1 Tax=Oryzias sinensis TaxID=183150 RepID=A0A8C8DIN7_9TELE
MGAANETCSDGNSTCFTSVSTFQAISSFKGFNFQGCASNNSGCGVVSINTFLGTNYTTNYSCCSTDRCNTVVSAAPSSKMALSAAIGASILAFMLSM